jgi:hypothetical protein
MNLEELKNNIKIYNIPERWYSIDEGLKPNAYIIFKNYSLWEYFCLDEKGERLDFRVFNRAEDAYEKLWSDLKKQSEVFNRFK